MSFSHRNLWSTARENRAGEVFHKIGVRVTWVDIATVAREHTVPMFTLVLVNEEENGSPYWDAQDALGFAAPSLHRAWVFWDRIEAAKARAPMTAIVLGDVMAHELAEDDSVKRNGPERGRMILQKLFSEPRSAHANEPRAGLREGDRRARATLRCGGVIDEP
jgi:hypothetical protein